MKIVNRHTLDVIFEDDLPTMRQTVMAAIAAGKSLEMANLRGADLSCLPFSGQSLIGADLTEVNFTKADLTRADFAGTILSRTNFCRAGLDNASFEMARLHETIWAEGVKINRLPIYVRGLDVVVVILDHDMAVGGYMRRLHEWREIQDHTVACMGREMAAFWGLYGHLLLTIARNAGRCFERRPDLDGPGLIRMGE